MKKRSIRSAHWYEEISEFFEIPENQLIPAVSIEGTLSDTEKQERPAALEAILRRFLGHAEWERREARRHDRTIQLTDVEKSEGWRDYVLVCLTGERRGFDKLPFYDGLIDQIVRPLLDHHGVVRVLDYGCGASLFTRVLCEDFGERVETVSADVCRYSVEFSGMRNRLYSSRARSLLIGDVMTFPPVEGVHLALADTTFEHLPNSTHQIGCLIDSLAPGGVLVENYSGCSTLVPHKSDTRSAYQQRDVNLDLIASRMELLEGALPARSGTVYAEDGSNRTWIKPGGPVAAREAMVRRIQGARGLIPRARNLVRRLWSRLERGA